MIDHLGIARFFYYRPDMTNQIDFAKELRTTIWRTKGDRFNSVRRLRRRDRLSSFSIAAFSVVAIALTILQKVYAVSSDSMLDNHFTALAILISMFVLIISLLEGTAAYDLKAERLHQNALDLDALQKNLGHLLSRAADGETLSSDTLEEINRKYEQTIKQCPENHESIDDLLFQSQYRQSPEFKSACISGFGALRIKVRHGLAGTLLFLIAWFVIGTLVFLVVGKLIAL